MFKPNPDSSIGVVWYGKRPAAEHGSRAKTCIKTMRLSHYSLVIGKNQVKIYTANNKEWPELRPARRLTCYVHTNPDKQGFGGHDTAHNAKIGLGDIVVCGGFVLRFFTEKAHDFL